MNNAELFKKVFGVYAEEFWAYPEEKMLDWLTSDAPTADVVKVVRCKDCKYYCEAEQMCNDTNGFDRYWKPTDFCSYGERREDVEETD